MPSKKRKTKAPKSKKIVVEEVEEKKDTKPPESDQELDKFTLKKEKEQEESPEKQNEDKIVEKPIKEPPTKHHGFWKFFFIFISFAVLTAALTGGFIIYSQGVKNLQGTPSPSPTLYSPTPAPTASASSTVKRSDLSVEVLNGSGTSGVASEAKDFLESLGYTVANTGNADNFDFANTEISIKDSKKDYLETLTKDLSDKYSLATESSSLDASSDYDAVITIGAK